MTGNCELNFFAGTGDSASARCQATIVPIEPCGARGKPRPCLGASYGTVKTGEPHEIFSVCFSCLQALIPIQQEIERRDHAIEQERQ